MSLTLLTSKLIDIATAHANILGIGNPYMPDDHSGWVLSRLTIEMERYPEVDSEYTVTTWAESWNRHFSERAFRISSSSGEVLGWARSIWMVLDTENRSNAGLDGLKLDESMIDTLVCPIARQGKHRQIVEDTGEPENPRQLKASVPVRKYRFGYSDLDAYRHVNTVRYVGLLMNQLPLEVHDAYMVNRIELSFLHEGEYGKEVDILCHEVDEKVIAYLLRRSLDKKDVLYSRIFLKKR